MYIINNMPDRAQTRKPQRRGGSGSITDIKVLISALDSYHDFSKTRNNNEKLDKKLAKNIIRHFLDTSKHDEFDKYSNSNFEQKLYEYYVTNNINIRKLGELQ